MYDVVRTALVTIVAASLAARTGSARAAPEDVPGEAGLIDDAGGFAEADPATRAAAAERYAAALAYSSRRAGIGLAVVEGDTIVFEAYAPDYDPRRAHHIWSGTKTFTCALAAAAVADGKLAWSSTLGGALAGLPEGDARAALSVSDLLSLTSGLAESGEVFTRDALRTPQRVPDKEAWALSQIRAIEPPGTRFRYAASAFIMFGLLARHALAEDPLAYLERRVLAPIGFQHRAWLRDGASHALWSFGSYTTVRSWARFGMLLRDDGVFRGARVLPAGALARCFEGSAAMPAYGLGVWLNREAKQPWLPGALRGRFASQGAVLLPGGPDDLIAAAGYHDNRLYVVPSRGLVIVRFGRGHPDFEDDAFLARLLPPR